MLQPRFAPPLPKGWNLVLGEADVQNRFPATVSLIRPPPFADVQLDVCSGVLVAPRLVLTAGECVCERRNQPAPGGGQQTVIDTASCVRSATVTFVRYESPNPATPGSEGIFQNRVGEVRPHPDLKIVLDEQGNIVSSEADLAVIELDEAYSRNPSPIALAEVDIRVNESLFMVGFDALSSSAFPERRFRHDRVTRILDAGARALFDQPQRDVYKGESGGPCIRETGRGMALVGIMNRSLGAEASFTSTFPYRDWIHQEIQRAAGASPAPR
jgi:hypothetical protein